jgi:hypothetical protein
MWRRAESNGAPHSPRVSIEADALEQSNMWTAMSGGFV